MREFVVGLDGSDHSRMALQWGVAVARAAGVPVRAVQAWSNPRSRVVPLGPDPAAATAEEMDEQTKEDVAAIAAEELGPSVDIEAEAVRGSAAGSLLEAVGPDSVLVLGSRGRGGFAGLLLGSVSQ